MCHFNLIGDLKMSSVIEENPRNSSKCSMDSNLSHDSNIDEYELSEWNKEEINRFGNFKEIHHQNTSVLNVIRPKDGGHINR